MTQEWVGSVDDLEGGRQCVDDLGVGRQCVDDSGVGRQCVDDSDAVGYSYMYISS